MVSASIIETLHQADQEATLWLNSLSVPWTDNMWIMFSDIAFWIPAYIICILFVFKMLGWKKAMVVIVSAVLAFALCDQLSNLVKHSVTRLRPSYSLRMIEGGLNILEKRGGFYGFFSAHAANAFSLATCLSIGFRNDNTRSYNAFRGFSMLWASLVSVSRVFVGKHYLGDILVGAMIGITIGYLMGRLSRFVIRKYIDRIPSTVREESFPSGSPSIP